MLQYVGCSNPACIESQCFDGLHQYTTIKSRQSKARVSGTCIVTLVPAIGLTVIVFEVAEVDGRYCLVTSGSEG